MQLSYYFLPNPKKVLLIMKTAVLGVLALLLQLYKIYKLRKITKYYRFLINKIASMQILSIKQLKYKISKGFEQIGGYVLVQGQLISQDQTLRSVLDQKKIIAYSELVVDKVFQIGDSRNTVRKKVRRMLAGLLKLTDGDNFINIYETLKTKFFTSNFIKKTKSYTQKIFNFGWLLSIILKSPSRVISNMYTQFFIPNGARVTILAEIPSSISASELSLVKPIMIAGSKQRIRLYYQSKLYYNNIFMILMSVISLLTSYLLFKIYLKPWLAQPRPSAKKSQINKIQKIQVVDRSCCRCHNSLSNVINSPCNHLMICSDCNYMQKVCLQCEKQPKQKIIIYPC